MTAWRWSSFAQAPATRLPWLWFILIVGTLLLIALLTISPDERPRAEKPQKNANTLSDTSLWGRHGPKR
jgi:hypothetical protein